MAENTTIGLDRLTEVEKQIFALAKEAGALLSHKQLRIAVAESCTGGGLSYWLTRHPGSSAWFECSWVTYSNWSKSHLLHLDENLIEEAGAVSEVVAIAMADSALAQSQANFSIAITGVAGPSGGTPEKPVGTVWIAWGERDKETLARSFALTGDREAIREQSILHALTVLLARLAYS